MSVCHDLKQHVEAPNQQHNESTQRELTECNSESTLPRQASRASKINEEK